MREQRYFFFTNAKKQAYNLFRIMAFQQSSCNITLNGTVLTATCQRADGAADTESSINLNSCIANDNGRLVQCSGGNFGP
jgi:hypothetical protein